MDSITIGWKKQASDEVEFLPTKQCLKKDTNEKRNNQGNKFKKKQVQFSFGTFNNKHERTFINTEQSQTNRIRNESFNMEDQDNKLSSSSTTNIFISQ